MKKILKKINYKILFIILGTAIIMTICFYIGKLSYGRSILINTKFDEWVPFISQFVYFYIIWFPIIVIIPYYLGIKDKKMFGRYIVSMIIFNLIAVIIYTVFPGTFNRFNGEFSNLPSAWIVSLIYANDLPSSCLPSLHASTCLFMIYSIIYNKIFNKKSRIIIMFFSLNIILSTVFIKQHAIYDLLASLIISLIVWFVVGKTKLDQKFIKFLNLS